MGLILKLGYYETYKPRIYDREIDDLVDLVDDSDEANEAKTLAFVYIRFDSISMWNPFSWNQRQKFIHVINEEGVTTWYQTDNTVEVQAKDCWALLRGIEKVLEMGEEVEVDFSSFKVTLEKLLMKKYLSRSDAERFSQEMKVESY